MASDLVIMSCTGSSQTQVPSVRMTPGIFGPWSGSKGRHRARGQDRESPAARRLLLATDQRDDSGLAGAGARGGRRTRDGVREHPRPEVGGRT